MLLLIARQKMTLARPALAALAIVRAERSAIAQMALERIRLLASAEEVANSSTRQSPIEPKKLGHMDEHSG
jgi:hypothetical protein